MASGLPVITTRAAGAAEIIRHGEEGLIVEEARGDLRRSPRPTKS
jgi:glycosyltransferase involved in cell wall biosynthesis